MANMINRKILYHNRDLIQDIPFVIPRSNIHSFEQIHSIIIPSSSYQSKGNRYDNLHCASLAGVCR